MAWATINPLETSPGAVIVKSLMTRIRDNPIAAIDPTVMSVPDTERMRVPQCLRTAELDIFKALTKTAGPTVAWATTPKWNLRAFQTPGAWSLPGGAAARTYFIEMWSGGAAGTRGGSQRGGGSGMYFALNLPVGAGVTIDGVVGAGGVSSGGAGGDTTLVSGPGTATVPGAPGGGSGASGHTFGGAVASVLSVAGSGSLVYTAAAIEVTSEGAAAPFIGGSSSASLARVDQAFRPNPVVGCGGAGTFVSAAVAQNGGDGMVLVWWLE